MAADLIASTLQGEITAGKIVPGTDLIQTELAERFGVSRIPVRDALRLLASDGLVTIVPNRGARVIRLTTSEVREVFDLRILLECDCLRRAIANMTNADLHQIEHALLKSNLDAVTEDWAQGDWLFHATLYGPAARPRQTGIIHNLRRTCQMHVSAYRELPIETPRWLDDHAQLLELCRSADSEAAVNTLQRHLAVACETLTDRMED